MPSVSVEDIKFFAIQSKFVKERNKTPRLMITNNHPFMQTLQNRLNDLSDTIAYPDTSPHNIIEVDALRPFSLTHTGDYSRFAEIQFKHMTRDQYLRTQVWHTNGIVHLVYHRNKMGIMLLGDLIHEMEHSNQDNGFGYTEEEQFMLKISQAGYIHPEEDYVLYQNNYREVWARTREIRMYIQAYDAINDDPEFTYKDKKIYLRASRKLYNHIKEHITQINMMSAIAAQREKINTLDVNQLRTIFPDIANIEDARTAIQQFLHDNASELCNTAMGELESAMSHFELVINDLEEDIAMYNKNIPYNTRMQIIEQYAHAQNIPSCLLPEVQRRPPYILYCDEKNYKAQIREALRQLQSPILTQDEHGALCIMGHLKTLARPAPDTIDISSGIEKYYSNSASIDAMQYDKLGLDDNVR